MDLKNCFNNIFFFKSVQLFLSYELPETLNYNILYLDSTFQIYYEGIDLNLGPKSTMRE